MPSLALRRVHSALPVHPALIARPRWEEVESPIEFYLEATMPIHGRISHVMLTDPRSEQYSEAERQEAELRLGYPVVIKCWRLV